MKKIKLLLVLTLLLLVTESSFSQTASGGEVVGRNIFGLATDYQGDPVLIEDRPLIYNNSAFEEIITIKKSNFLVSGFNNLIGGIYLTKLGEDRSQKIDTIPLKLVKMDGLTSPAGGKITDWNTVLFSETGLINGADSTQFVTDFKSYFKGKANLVNPYKYGWVSEVIVLNDQGQAKTIKNYSLGRLFANQVVVMPDNKTIYTIDKLGNLYMFVAKQARSLAKGKLYAVVRNNDQVDYALLGAQAALKVKFKLKRAKFKSIFKSKVPKKQRCSKMYTYVETIYGQECLMVKKKYKKYAGLFEPIRVMAMKGYSAFVAANSQMDFNQENMKITLSHVDQNELILVLGEDLKLNSKYIIKESL